MNTKHTYTCLADLLHGDTAYHFGRILYKYTDCGPWITFIVADKPARIEHFGIEIRESDNGLVAKSMDSQPALDALQFLGFEPDGSNHNRWHSRKEMQKRIDAFFRKERKQGSIMPWTLERNDLCIGCLRVTMSRSVGATTRDVYYESDDANAIDIPGCIGVRVGSIVEGCDNDIDPITLMFPFTEQEFDDAVAGIDRDAAIVWEWANVARDKNGRRHSNGKTDAERGLDWPLL